MARVRLTDAERREKACAYSRRYYAEHKEKAKAQHRAWYAKNKAHQNEKSRLNMARRHKARASIVIAAKAVPCMDCGGMFPHYVMDLDHVRGTKVASVSVMVRDYMKYTEAEIVAEMAKCEVVCSNCHRIRTYRHGGAPKSRVGPHLVRDEPGLFDVAEVS
jgi:hypothetical protein